LKVKRIRIKGKHDTKIISATKISLISRDVHVGEGEIPSVVYEFLKNLMTTHNNKQMLITMDEHDNLDVSVLNMEEYLRVLGVLPKGKYLDVTIGL
jgi:hypothetical protein